ncbi:glycosyltransferase family 4 protein [Baekduia soli]|uniref:Glycosyltransferase family 4 protein n=1 Tax=Baekduia soli TaxID=496014 RepID=A0A5B8UB76_9ACTN|nr:glycosyltransferase family 4 protein [Baekduia soli]QEC50078.1 glycosyltransferase family 4 protein [Baekduia soli]
MRVLYSFPNRLGMAGIGTTAFEQVAGLAALGAEVTLVCGSLERPLPRSVAVHETMRAAGMKVPYRLVGKDRALALHDRRCARRLTQGVRPDIVHAWPLGALRTLQAARDLGVPSVLERPNAHTAFAFDAVAAVGRELGIAEQPGSPHAHDPDRLAREEREYAAADALLCPSDFVRDTFLEHGHDPERLLRHRYGYDPARFSPGVRDPRAPFTAVFAGRGEPRKGLHLALRAWLASEGPRRGGRFVIAGPIDPVYRPVLAPMLADPSVVELGPTTAMAEVMRGADVLVLPSVEEGSALVTYEARATGCVLLVSDHAGAACTPGHDALVHPAGDADALRRDLVAVQRDPALLARLGVAGLEGAAALTWEAAATVLLDCYRRLVDDWSARTA